MGVGSPTNTLTDAARRRASNFFEHVRDGSNVIPPEFANQHTGNASWEVARSLYGQHNLSREHKLLIADAAQIVDVPAYTWGYASVLHDAGIKYFVAASNSWRAPVMLLGRDEREVSVSEGPDGGRVLMWYSRLPSSPHTVWWPVANGVDPRFVAGFSSGVHAPGLYGQYSDHLRYSA